MTDTEETTRPMFVHKAEAAKLKAEADKTEAETRKLIAEALEAESKAAKVQLELDSLRHKRDKELAGDEYFHVYRFVGTVTETSVAACRQQLTVWERQSDQPLTVDLQINSPGGGIFEGFELVDHINGMHARGHVVNTHAFGMAASMGGVLLQTGKERRMGHSARLLIHEAQFRTGGKTGDVEDEIELVHQLQDTILDMYADRAKLSGATHPMSRSAIKRKWRRKDWWINAQDCLRFGFIDTIA